MINYREFNPNLNNKFMKITIQFINVVLNFMLILMYFNIEVIRALLLRSSRLTKAHFSEVVLVK